MTAESSPISFGLWNPPGAAFPIKYSLPLLHEIDFFVADGYRRIPHGGLEVGGLLYGTEDADGLTLLAFEPIDCQHLFGPGFVLSDADVEALRLHMAKPFHHDTHGELVLAGWFISRGRSELRLNERDVELFEDLFAGPRQVTMLVKPEKFKPTRYGFLVRQKRSRLTDPECRDTFLLPLTARPADQNVGTAPTSGRASRLAREAFPAATSESVLGEPVETPSDPVTPHNAAPAPLTPIASPADVVVTRTAGSIGQGPTPEEAAVVTSIVAPEVPPTPVSEGAAPLIDGAIEGNVQPAPLTLMDQVLTLTPAPLVALPKKEAVFVLTPAGEDDFVPFAPRRRRRFADDDDESDDTRGLPRWLEIAMGAAVLLLSAAAVLWTYVNFLLPPIPLRSDVRAGSTVVTWPPELTNGAETVLIVWTAGQPSERQLTREEQRSGSTVLPSPGTDSTVQLRSRHWGYVRSGQIRLVQAPSAAPPPPARTAPRRYRHVREEPVGSPASEGPQGSLAAQPGTLAGEPPATVPPSAPQQRPSQP